MCIYARKPLNCDVLLNAACPSNQELSESFPKNVEEDGSSRQTIGNTKRIAASNGFADYHFKNRSF